MTLPSNKLAIDVSNNNPINLWELKQANPEVLICKATEGTNFQDKTYHEHRDLAAQAKIIFGSYLFLHPNSNGSEADYFLEYAKPHPNDIVAVDVETSDGSTMDKVAERALECLVRLRTHGQITDPWLYCSSSWWKTLTVYEPDLKHFPVWEAQYPGAFTKWTPAIAALRVKLFSGATVRLWQWTDHYRVGNRYFDASRIFSLGPGV